MDTHRFAQVLLQVLNFASVLTTGLMIWKGLGLVCNTESPIVVVLRCAVHPVEFLAKSHRFQWLHGTCVLPRRPPIPDQPSQRTVSYRRHHGVQDSRCRYSHRTPRHGNARYSVEEIRASAIACCFTWQPHVMSDVRHVTASPLGQRQLILTKGDNNPVDDIELYQGLEWLERKHIVGKVRGYDAFSLLSIATLRHQR